MKYVGLYDNNKDIVTKDKLDAVEAAIPTKVSELTNDANYITAAQAPVQSVNNKTGAVSLTATDVSAIPSTLTGTAGQVLTKTADGQEWKDVTSPQPSTTTPSTPTEAGSVGTSDAYARGDHSHPSEVFWCTVTGNSSSGYTCDKTQAEILVAYNAGKVCVAKYNQYTYYLEFVNSENINFYNSDANGFSILQFNIDKGINIYEYAFDTLFAPHATKITLTVAGWNSAAKTQSVTVSGVSADATKQEIRVMPVDAALDSPYIAAGVQCIAQAANSLTFGCETVPTEAIEVYVVIQGVDYSAS